MKAIKIYRPGGLSGWAWLLCLCLGLNLWAATQTALAQSPANSTVSGTITGNNDVRASTIKSTQIISSGKTAYWAENEIVLNPGFEVKAGATFTANIQRDSLHHVKMLTYNLWGDHSDYEKHAQVIKNSGADVVSVQEVRHEYKFNNLKDWCGLSGVMLTTVSVLGINCCYGIGLLWNERTVGRPIETTMTRINTDCAAETDNYRGFIVAEFNDFCFVATHYSLDTVTYQMKMSEAILSNTLVQKCFNNGKPVYIAGDMNAKPNDRPIIRLKEEGFVVLDTTIAPGRDRRIDLILERNRNSYHKTLESGIPVNTSNWTLSDHFPYYSRVKIK